MFALFFVHRMFTAEIIGSLYMYTDKRHEKPMSVNALTLGTTSQLNRRNDIAFSFCSPKDIQHLNFKLGRATALANYNKGQALTLFSDMSINDMFTYQYTRILDLARTNQLTPTWFNRLMDNHIISFTVSPVHHFPTARKIDYKMKQLYGWV